MIPNCSLQTAWGGIAMVKLSDPGRLKCLRAVQLPRRRCPPAGRMGAAAAGTRRGRQLTAQRRAREECVTIPTKPQENAETHIYLISAQCFMSVFRPCFFSEEQNTEVRVFPGGRHWHPACCRMVIEPRQSHPSTNAGVGLTHVGFLPAAVVYHAPSARGSAVGRRNLY